jgi:hypothetical protein
VFQHLRNQAGSWAWPSSLSKTSVINIRCWSRTTKACPGKGAAQVERNSLRRCAVEDKWFPSRTLI